MTQVNKKQKLLIISHTAHYQMGGELKGWGATVREVDYLARLFESVVHLAPVYESEPRESDLAYTSKNIHVRSIPYAGGQKISEKFKIIPLIPIYIKRILEEVRKADVIHVRCPCNVGLISVLILIFLRKPKKRWVKYAGNWNPSESDNFSNWLQRKLLSLNVFRGLLTINGQWPDQKKHMNSFYNPCLTESELEQANQSVGHKKFAEPLSLIFVGSLESTKGIYQVLDVMKSLVSLGIKVKLNMIGGSSERKCLEKKISEMNLDSYIRLEGWLSREALIPHYQNAHFILLPSAGEGWPKVLSEAMSYGVIPIASNVGSIPQYLNKFETGKALKRNDIEAYVEAIQNYLLHPQQWAKESQNSLLASKQFTYENYLQRVKKELSLL